MNVRHTIDARTESLDAVVEMAARTVYAGGTVIFPTDTVYGIGCDPQRIEAVDRIYGAKRRPGHKPLTLHLASVSEFLEYAKENPLAVLAARRLMPGPVALIVRRPSFVHAEVTSGLATLGFRVPDDPLCRALLERCGPLAATSANASGELPYRGDADPEALPPADLFIENGLTRYGTESTVIDLSGDVPRLLREGVIGYDRLTELLGRMERVAVPVRTNT